MAKLPSSSGSLRAHASTASKARPHGAFTTSVPTVKKGTFTGDDDSSDSSSSSDSDSDSDAETKNETSSDFLKKVSTPSSKGKTNGASAKHDAKSSKTATPARSPTVNGLGAAAVKKEAKSSAKQIKKEDTSSESESGSDSDSSSDEKTKKTEKRKKVAAESKIGKKSKKSKKSESSSASDSGSETSSTSDSESESDKAEKSKSKSKSPAKSAAKAKLSAAKESKEAAAKSKSSVKKESTSESDSSSSESGGESESESESEDPSQQIAEQLKNDVKSSKSQFSKAQPTSAQPTSAQPPSEKPSKKKAKLTKPPVEDEDSDVEMMDQSLALTNGGVPTNVGDVPEFVVPDFHLRKLEGDSNAAEVSKFFSKAQLEGKQVWYITAPASVPVTVVQDSTIPMNKAQQGLSVLSHNGDDYRMVFDNPAASSSFRLLIPSKKGNEYTLLERQVDQTMHFTRSETFGPDGPSNVITTKTISTSRPARPQPEGLRARYTPLGVPAPKPTIAPVNKAIASVAAEASTSTPSKGSSKKKRKHTDDGEDGFVSATTPAIITTPVPAPTKAAAVSSSNKKNPPAEKSAKKQKTSSHDTPRKETPVPLPQHGSRSESTTSANSVPLGRSRMSASPGAAIPVTQVPLPAKYTQVPLPSLPAPSSSAVTGGTQFSSPAVNKAAEKQAKKAEKDRKKAEKEAEKERKKAEKEAAKAAARSRGIANQSQIAPPRPWESH